MNTTLTTAAVLLFVTTGALARQAGMPVPLVPAGQPAAGQPVKAERVQPIATTTVPAALTWSQARARIEAQGYSDVRGLAQDGNGTWQARAVKDGKPAVVSVAATGVVLAR